MQPLEGSHAFRKGVGELAQAAEERWFEAPEYESQVLQGFFDEASLVGIPDLIEVHRKSQQ